MRKLKVLASSGRRSTHGFLLCLTSGLEHRRVEKNGILCSPPPQVLELKKFWCFVYSTPTSVRVTEFYLQEEAMRAFLGRKKERPLAQRLLSMPLGVGQCIGLSVNPWRVD